ncbi:MAG: hypothetical protein K2Y27_05615 [Xanthobacteraceae bacterium]|nr:hypothetical protein [Xanthobacteraceae bacterium]
MKTLTACLLISITGTIAASAQSTTTSTTDVQRDPQGRVSSITTTTQRGTERTDYLYTGTGPQETTHETTTFEPAQRGYHPLGRSGYHPLGR